MDSNIDRYFAIWQAAHPNSWFDGENKDLADQDLLPFFSPKGQDPRGFWTSNSARHTTKFGYTYEDVLSNPNETVENFERKHEWSLRPKDLAKDWHPVIHPDMIPLDLSRAQVYRGHLEYVPPGPPPVYINIKKLALPEKSEISRIERHELKTRDIENTGNISSANGDQADINSEGTVEKATPRTSSVQKLRDWFVDDAVEGLVFLHFAI